MPISPAKTLAAITLSALAFGGAAVPAMASPASGKSQAVFHTHQRASAVTQDAPVFTSISATKGHLQGGNAVTVHGTGFAPGMTAKFGTRHGMLIFESATQATVTVPPGIANGTVPVTLITADGMTSNSLSYTYETAPAITSITPAEGSVAGGQIITLKGSGFTGMTSVKFGTVHGSSAILQDDTQVTVIVPPSSTGAGTVPVTITNSQGTSQSVYKYVA